MITPMCSDCIYQHHGYPHGATIIYCPRHRATIEAEAERRLEEFKRMKFPLHAVQLNDSQLEDVKKLARTRFEQAK